MQKVFNGIGIFSTIVMVAWISLVMINHAIAEPDLNQELKVKLSQYYDNQSAHYTCSAVRDNENVHRIANFDYTEECAIQDLPSFAPRSEPNKVYWNRGGPNVVLHFLDHWTKRAVDSVNITAVDWVVGDTVFLQANGSGIASILHNPNSIKEESLDNLILYDWDILKVLPICGNFDLKASGVYNLRGEHIGSFQSDGSNFVWNSSQTSSGVYFVHVRTNQVSESVKINIINGKIVSLVSNMTNRINAAPMNPFREPLIEIRASVANYKFHQSFWRRLDGAQYLPITLFSSLNEGTDNFIDVSCYENLYASSWGTYPPRICVLVAGDRVVDPRDESIIGAKAKRAFDITLNEVDKYWPGFKSNVRIEYINYPLDTLQILADLANGIDNRAIQVSFNQINRLAGRADIYTIPTKNWQGDQRMCGLLYFTSIMNSLDMQENQVIETALHNMGHALGLGHSGDVKGFIGFDHCMTLNMKLEGNSRNTFNPFAEGYAIRLINAAYDDDYKWLINTNEIRSHSNIESKVRLIRYKYDRCSEWFLTNNIGKLPYSVPTSLYSFLSMD